MPRPKSNIDKRILAAAKGLFLRSGVDSTSLRQIAQDAGTNIGMVYYYFPSKDEIFFALVDDVYGRLLADLERGLSLAGVEGTPTIENRLRQLFLRLGAVTNDEVDVIHLVLREALSSTERRQRLIERFMKGHIPLVFKHLLQGQAAGELRTTLHPMVLLFSTFALAGPPQIMRRRATMPVALVPEGSGLSEQLLEVLLHGISKNH
ncbi:MAG: TetR/AcrR family transcriptional regulator [Deltaproteobacteria bacterium]|nr:TetR/AcrR family transcriptional regulator [Deltaproteobacteria bacterium]